MNEYLFLFRGPRHEPMDVLKSPEQWQKHMQKWADWIGEMAKNGRLVSAQPLESSVGKQVRRGGQPATDGPFTEGKDMIVGGYLLCKAESFDEAVALARGCPSLEDFENSVVEVRIVKELKL
jgi:hypothetical protein